MNAEERWARVEPGIVLDELNAQLAPLGLRFAPDISTASRATIGGMMANNSAARAACSTARPSTTCWRQTVALSDGSVVHFREIPRSEVPAGDTLEAACYRTVLRSPASTPTKSTAAIRRSCAASAATTWTSSPIRRSRSTWRRIMVGSEGTLGVVLEAKLRLVPLPKAKAVMVIMFADLLESLAAAPVILRHKPSAVEVMDKSILDYTRQNAALDRIRNTYIEGDPAATLCVEFYADRKEDLPPRLQALEEDLRARNLGYAYRAETDLAAQAQSGACAKPRWAFRWR